LFSREGWLEEALRILEDDYTRQRNDRQAWIEDEIVGILAGVYKRIWSHDQQEGFLTKSYETYRWGWRRSSTTYLGINAATTALWLNKLPEAQAIAREVKSILEQRRRMIRQKTDSRYDLNYWDLVTLAEANLLVNELDSAKEMYNLAFSRYGSQTDNIEVTRKQLSVLAGKLSIDSAFTGSLSVLGGE
jgi:hypothetical protein